MDNVLLVTVGGTVRLTRTSDNSESLDSTLGKEEDRVLYQWDVQDPFSAALDGMECLLLTMFGANLITQENWKQVEVATNNAYLTICQQFEDD